MRGGVREGWVEATLRELVAEGGVFSDGDWVETKDQDPTGDVRLIQLADIGPGEFRDRSSRFLTRDAAERLRCTFLAPGDVLVARMPDPLGRACLFPGDGDGRTCVTAVDVSIIRPGEAGVSTRWLAWAINSPQFRTRVQALQSGTTRKRISRRNLGTIPLRVPPSGEQLRIVAKIDELFSELDAGVAALESAQAKLERYRASVLKGAVEGRLTEQWRKENPPEETGEVLLKRILAERRKRWEEEQLAAFQAKERTPPKGWREKYREPEGPDTSELPELPEGWCWGTLDQAFRVFVGATPSRAVPAFWNGSIPWVSSGEIAFQDIVRTREGVSQSGLDSSSTTVHPPGTVMLAMIGEGRTRGQSAILRIHACNNQNSAAIRVSETPCDPSWVFRFLQSRYEETRGIGSGNNQPALNKAKVKSIPIPLPPLPEQWLIGNRIAELFAVIHEMDGRIGSAKKMSSTLRQSILKLAFEGRLVPQDPNDEPASVLLERIRAARKAEPPAAKRRLRKRKSSQGSLDL